jgi:hypothetical protein
MLRFAQHDIDEISRIATQSLAPLAEEQNLFCRNLLEETFLLKFIDEPKVDKICRIL